ncbi:universal stress protein [Pedobacter kyonggii]|uniref:Universal stress protein n=1 Tax=Pedobacter kyonggii TaxID=1926871 RepID=A0A4V2JH44_9SPHI|nr:universal stress protein [Pedobacter kyonggii]TBO43639.1 universal stress protein [Pedobacter kyonggii]
MKTILVMTDFSRAAKNAAQTALGIAEHFGAELLLLHSYHLPQIILAEPLKMDYKEMEEKAKISLEKEKERLLKQMKTRQQYIRIHTINTIGPISEVLYDIQQGEKLILAVMGRHKRHKSNFLFANHIHIAMRNSDCPLLILSSSEFLPDKCRINFASDLNEKDIALLESIEKIRKAFKASLSLSYVMESRGLVADFDEEDRITSFQRVLQKDKFSDIPFHLLKSNAIASEINRMFPPSKDNLLLLVNRTHGLLHEIFHSSQCRAIIKKHHGAILVLPELWKPACQQ